MYHVLSLLHNWIYSVFGVFPSGPSVASKKGKENMAEISLICEENLLDTIFHACDTQRRGTAVIAQ